MGTASGTWKMSERRNGKKLGTRRTPLSGSNGGVTQSDTYSDYWFVENKMRGEIPVYELFRKYLKRSSGKTLVFIYNNERLFMNFDDFIRLTRATNPEPHEPDYELRHVSYT